MKTKKTKSANSRTLTEISESYSELEVLIEQNGGEITPDVEKQIDEYFANLGKERDAKIENYCGYIRELEFRAAARIEEGKRIQNLGKTGENKAKYLKSRLLNFMSLHKVEKVDTLRFVVTRAKNAAAPVVLADWVKTDPAQLEERFRRVKFEPNLDEITKALKDGEELEFASFGEKGENLRIK